MLTEKEAWTKIAERLEDPNYDMQCGLCHEVFLLSQVDGSLNFDLAREMSQKATDWLEILSNPKSYYAYPPGQNKAERAAQARIFASECEP